MFKKKNESPHELLNNSMMAPAYETWLVLQSVTAAKLAPELKVTRDHHYKKDVSAHISNPQKGIASIYISVTYDE